MYTIKHAAEMVGLSVSTLRAWERRYGVVAPARTDSGYRLYDDAAVHALSLMNSLVLEGWSARQAAEETKQRMAEGENPSSAPSPVSPTTAPSPDADTDRFVDAAARLDAVELTRILDDRFSRASFESVVDGWLMPTLCALGDAWADGQVSVAGEHLASYAVQRRLAAAYDAAASLGSGPRIVVGLAPGARHELGALAFAAAARRAGLAAAYVGADLPAGDWVTATNAQEAECAVLAISRAADLKGLRSVVADLQADEPERLIAVGGALAEQAPEECLRMGHEIGPAAAYLAATLRDADAPSI